MRRAKAPSKQALPERLIYLQPFRRKFASRPEDLDEDSGSAPLMALLSKRIHGLSIDGATQVLKQDHAALEQWLSSLGEQGDPLHFVLGFFLTCSPEEIVTLIREEEEKPPEPKLILHIEFPTGAKLKRVPGGDESQKLIALNGIWMAIYTMPKEAMANFSGDNWHTSGGTIVSITFGAAVTGRKLLITKQTDQGFHKGTEYALEVPGGHVYASMQPIGKKVLHSN